MQAMVSQEARLEVALQKLIGKNVDNSKEAGEIRVLILSVYAHKRET